MLKSQPWESKMHEKKRQKVKTWQKTLVKAKETIILANQDYCVRRTNWWRGGEIGYDQAKKIKHSTPQVQHEKSRKEKKLKYIEGFSYIIWQSIYFHKITNITDWSEFRFGIISLNLPPNINRFIFWEFVLAILMPPRQNG